MGEKNDRRNKRRGGGEEKKQLNKSETTRTNAAKGTSDLSHDDVPSTYLDYYLFNQQRDNTTTAPET